MLDLAGLPVPESMHGRSWLPLLRADDDVVWRDAFYYAYYGERPKRKMRVVPKCRGVRTKRWKCIEYPEGPPGPDNEPEYELYNFEKDWREMNNVHGRGSSEKIVRRLRGRMNTIRRRTGDPRLK